MVALVVVTAENSVPVEFLSCDDGGSEVDDGIVLAASLLVDPQAHRPDPVEEVYLRLDALDQAAADPVVERLECGCVLQVEDVDGLGSLRREVQGGNLHGGNVGREVHRSFLVVSGDERILTGSDA